MLFNNSPVKSISEKLKSPQASIKNLKFEREKDFKSFLKYIEREAKELDKIKLPPRNEIEKKSGGGLGALLGLGAIGLLSLFGGGKGGDGNQYAYGDRGSGNIFRGPYAVGRKGGDDDQKIDDPDLTRSGFPSIRDFTSTSAAVKNAFGFGSVKAATLKETTIEDVTQTESFQRKTKKITKQQQKTLEYSATTQGGERVPTIEDLRQEQTGGGGGGSGKKKGRSGKNRIIKPKPGEIEKSIKIFKKFPEQLRLFEDKDRNVPDDGGKAGQARIEKELGLSDSDRVARGLGDADPGKQLKGQFSDLKTKREYVAKNKGNIVRKGFFQSIKSDFKKPTLGINTMEDMFSKLRLGKKTDLFKANPKGMNLFKLGTFSKGKTGFMIADFGLAAYDLYSSLRKVTPRSNIGASLLDLVGINLNNFVADLMNNPSMLREYVSITNDPRAINANKNREIINQNIRKIKEIKKKDFTGDDITEGAIGTKQFINNLGKVLNNKINKINPFVQVVPQPNPELFQSPSGESSYDNILGIFQVNTLEGGG